MVFDVAAEVADFVSESILRCRIDGTVTYFNRAAEAFYGIDAADVLGRGIVELATDRQHHVDTWDELLRTRAWHGKIRRTNSLGEPRIAYVRRYLVSDESGKPSEIVEIGNDPDYAHYTIDPRLRESENRNRQLIRHMPAALLQVDSSMTLLAFEQLRAQGVEDLAAYLTANPDQVEHSKDVVVVREANLAAVQLFRAREVAELTKPVRYLFAATPDMAQRVMVAAWEDKRNYTEEAKILTFTGELRDVSFSVTYPLLSEASDNTFIVIEDITERKKTEAQLRKLQSDYSHAARISTLGQLATSIAHEVKQPLAAIITNAETSLRWLRKEQFDIEKLIQLNMKIVESASHANNVIQRIRAMATKHEPSRGAFSVEDLIQDAALFVRHELETKSIQLAVEIDGDLPAISGDRVLLQQVIVNLLVNAVQAVSSEPLERRRVSVVGTLTDSDMISIEIRDKGRGVAAADMPRLFDAFFTTKEGGLGMGLAISHSLIEAHDGTIAASNDPAGGAVFEIRLPSFHESPLDAA